MHPALSISQLWINVPNFHFKAQSQIYLTNYLFHCIISYELTLYIYGSYLSHVTIVVSCLFACKISSAFSFLRIRITSLNMVVKDTQDTKGPISSCKSVLMHNGFPRSLKKDMELNCKCHRLNPISYKCKYVFHYYISDSSRMSNLLFKISVCVCL